MIQKKSAFTIIEIIFVIIIISILASVSISRLMTTRDDSKISACLSDIEIFLSDLTSYYTSQGNFSLITSNMTNVDIYGNFIVTPNNIGDNYTGTVSYVCNDLSNTPSVLFILNSSKSINSVGYEYTLNVIDANSSDSVDIQLIERMKRQDILKKYKISGLRVNN